MMGWQSVIGVVAVAHDVTRGKDREKIVVAVGMTECGIVVVWVHGVVYA